MVARKPRKAGKKSNKLTDLAPKPGKTKDVKGGATFGDIKGESQEKDHKDWIISFPR